jgi:hypothetical protein
VTPFEPFTAALKPVSTGGDILNILDERSNARQQYKKQ